MVIEMDENSFSTLEQYHRYLESNYEGGCERFFSPTGFLKDFQKTTELETQSVRNHVFAKDIGDAFNKLEPAVMGGQGVFDLTAEPGTGKTSVLPFKFPSKNVVVALPSPFDAWSAFQMATGDCALKLQGLHMGPNTAKVTYTDSYMAARAVMDGSIKFDVLIVDECDSPRGVTKFLAEVKVPGKLLVRMSASHGTTTKGFSKAFRVTETEDMPDPRQSVQALAAFVKKNHKNRSLVLMPDAQSVDELGDLLPDARRISTRSKLPDIARAIVNQEGSRLFIADDTCARGLNLNLDALFDVQMVTENGATRQVSPAELLQRKGRVGRNRDGWYFSPGLGSKLLSDSDVDVVRHNVTRAIAGVDQVGDARLTMTLKEAVKLKCAAVEPFVRRAEIRAMQVAVVSSSESETEYVSNVGSDSSSARYSSGSASSVKLSKVNAPSWLFHFGGASGSAGTGSRTDTYVVKSGKGLAFQRRTSSSGSSDSVSVARSVVAKQRKQVGTYDRSELPLVASGPFAVKERNDRQVASAVHNLPMSPPLMDLTELTYDLDWPMLIRDRLVSGGDLPTLVPPNSWRHTSAGGLGTDWLGRLDQVALADSTFSESEFEVVCRAWNKLVALAWVKKTPGLSNYSNFDRLEYCARYFQSYFILASAA